MFIFGGFTSKWSDRVLEIESDELESEFEGKTAEVIECVTINSGRVRFMGATWSSRLSESSQAESIEPGSKVVIEKAEGNLLHVY